MPIYFLDNYGGSADQLVIKVTYAPFGIRAKFGQKGRKLQNCWKSGDWALIYQNGCGR